MGRGALVFKGDKPKKKKKKSKHGAAKSDREESSSSTDAHITLMSKSSSAAAAAAVDIMPPAIKPRAASKSQQQQQQPQMVKGSGRITSSGTVVTGYDTLFEKEFQVGDAMVVNTTTTTTITGGEQQEMRVIKMRLSNTSCGISSSFSQNLSRPTEFFLLKKPGRNKQQSSQGSSEETIPSFGTFDGGGGKFVYRERTDHGSYRIKSEDVTDSKSRSELLRMRAKKTSDKYC